jgi:hypothetical protein
MALHKVRPNAEILHAAIVDGINVYVREVLLAHRLLEQSRMDEWTGPDLDDLKHAIASRIAASWETCEVEEEV